MILATPDEKTITRQRRLVKELEGAPSFRVARALWELVSEKEPLLLPEWRGLWQRVRDEVRRDHEAPDEVIDKIDEAVSSISTVADLTKVALKPESKVCILLGAGASAPQPSNIPTVAHLLPELWRRARKLGRDDIDRLAAWCDDRKISNIEDLLTAAYLSNFAAKNSAVSGLLNYFLFSDRENDEAAARSRFRRPPVLSQVDAASVALFQETLQGLFGLLTSTMIPAPPNTGHQEIVKFVEAHPKTSVVTTNYDGCLDEAFLRGKVHLNTYVEGEANSAEGIDLIKIHGSINWSYCESCHEVREFDLLSLKSGFERDTVSYAVVGICKNCGGQRRPLLIPPIGLKFIMFPNLIRLWNLARERIETADILIVVGFSFSEADSYINKIIERSMSINSRQTMIVCDPNFKLVPTLRDRYSARIDDFHHDRILEAVGSSAELLPKVFQSLLSPVAAKKPTTKSSK